MLIRKKIINEMAKELFEIEQEMKRLGDRAKQLRGALKEMVEQDYGLGAYKLLNQGSLSIYTNEQKHLDQKLLIRFLEEQDKSIDEFKKVLKPTKMEIKYD